MTLRARTLTLVLALLVGTVLLIGLVQLLNTRQAVLAQQEGDGLAMARLLAGSLSQWNEAGLLFEAAASMQQLVPGGAGSILEQVGLEQLASTMMQGGGVEDFLLAEAQGGTILYSTGVDSAAQLTAADRQRLELVLAGGGEQAALEADRVRVTVPVLRSGDPATVDGAVILFLSTAPLQAAMRRQLLQGGLAALGMLAAGVAVSLDLSRSVLNPVDGMTRAIQAVEQGEYRSAALAGVLRRADELGRMGHFFDRMAREVQARDRRLRLLRKVIPAGVGLSTERDFNRLLETIVVESQAITNADGGTLYILEKDQLRFMILRNTSMQFAMGGTQGDPVTLPPIPLYDGKTGQPNHHNIATYAALRKETVNIPDAYTAQGFDFSGTRKYDERTGYHSRSFLSIPLESDEREVIGVLQLINAQDPETGEVVPFVVDEVFETLVLLASISLAAYIRQAQLRKEIEKLNIEIDRSKQSRQVAEITETDYFRSLLKKVRELRKKKPRS
jgi:HAMP domain-containing protein